MGPRELPALLDIPDEQDTPDILVQTGLPHQLVQQVIRVTLVLPDEQDTPDTLGQVISLDIPAILDTPDRPHRERVVFLYHLILRL